MKIGKITISKTSALHYYKMIFRSLLFLVSLVIYIVAKVHGMGDVYLEYSHRFWPLLVIIWIIFTIEMILRFFPDDIESMGCQKEFAKNYVPKNDKSAIAFTPIRTFYCALFWIVLNAIIGILYFNTEWMDQSILMLIALAYSICDMICILFFCPFETWFLKNKCCGTCRIYNWDFAMMFTPFIFIPHWFTWSLLFIALLLLIRWELTHFRHPERFYEETNQCLECGHCKEHLCSHKKQLQRLQKRIQKGLFSGVNRVKNVVVEEATKAKNVVVNEVTKSKKKDK